MYEFIKVLRVIGMDMRKDWVRERMMWGGNGGNGGELFRGGLKETSGMDIVGKLREKMTNGVNVMEV
ncbi:hypothetical protein, partial [Neisseria sicca]|uniref:hypothetical protein n=1 Tax=Neisseria sicca TaxID=490 RepID=UPI001C999478